MFQFKEFKIEDSKTAMKVGTDGVLLGAWVSLTTEPDKILDIGTGTGLIALQLAQRSNAFQIDAVEVNDSAFEQAVENFENSDWGDRLFCYHASFSELVEELYQDEFYDLIVCNPPFFSEDYKSQDASRDSARFQDALPFSELLEGVSKLLSDKGEFSVIIPFSEEKEFIEIASHFRMFPSRITRVCGNSNSKLKRSLIQFSLQKQTPQEDELVIELSRHEYTSEYIKLVKDFYLKM